MNFLDLIIIGAVVVFAGLGAYSGFLRQLSTPVALLGAWLFSWVLEKPLATRLESWFASSQVAELASAALAFAVSFLAIKIVWAFIASRVAASEVLKPGNRALGALLGMAKGLVVSCLFVLLLVHLGKDEMREQSVCAGKVYEGYQWFVQTDFYRNARNAVDQAIAREREGTGLKEGVRNFLQEKVKNRFSGRAEPEMPDVAVPEMPAAVSRAAAAGAMEVRDAAAEMRTDARR